MKKNIVSTLLLLTGLSAFSCSSSAPSPEETPQPEGPQSADVEILTTTSNLGCDLTPSSVPFGGKTPANAVEITLDDSRTFQTIDGFGAAITGATAYNLLKMKPAERTAFLRRTFSPDEGYGMSYIRVCIGCSDFSLSDYTCCDTPGIENFALTAEETDYVIPVLKEILEINPGVKILASPWTAPRWMKVKSPSDRSPHNSWTSGHLNPDHYADYAEYFVRWIEAFRSHGIPVYAVTLQNEPLNRGNSASMFMGWDEQADFITSAVGPAFRNKGIDTKIYVFDHNYNYDNMDDQQGYPIRVFNRPDVAQYVAGAAFHNYGGNKDELLRVHEAHPGMELVFTESTAGDWNDGSNLSRRLVDDMEEITLGTVNRWCRGAIIWNLMLDANRGPNRPGGCTTGFGAVDIADDYSTIRRNSFYYIMAHMSHAAKPGAVRIAASAPEHKGLTYTAFRNPDGSHALAASNRSDRVVCLRVSDGTNSFTANIPPKAVTSMKW